MSGGAFDYTQYQITNIAEQITQLIHEEGYGPATMQRLQEAVYFLTIAQIYAQRIDWLLCGDDGEETFHTRLEAELAAMKEGTDSK